MEIYKNLDLNDIENEIWLPVVGYEGLYAVSNMGRVKSLGNNKLRKEKILSQILNNNNGYLQLTLYKEGKMQTFLVHRLVATAFLENPNGYRCVNHKNEIKTDNRVENLEWCDDKYNLNYKNAQAKRVASTDYKAFQARRVAHTDYKAIVEKRKIDYKAIAEKLSRQVYQYSLDGTLVSIWESTKECKKNGYNQGAVSQCCRGKLKHYKNYIWSYTEL